MVAPTTPTQAWATNNYQISEELSLTRGGHQIRWSSLVQSRLVAGHLPEQRPYTFNGQITGNALADFLLGRSSPLCKAAPEWDEKLNIPSAYAQDNIRVSSKLAVNIGIRWTRSCRRSTRSCVPAFSTWTGTDPTSAANIHQRAGGHPVGRRLRLSGQPVFPPGSGYFSPRFGCL